MNALGDVFEYSTDAVFGIDTTGIIRYSNRAFERLLGYSGEQLCGRRCACLLCGTDLNGQEICGPHCPIPKTCNGDPEITDFDMVIRHANGNSILVNIGASYVPRAMQAACDRVAVIFSMRRVDPQRMLQRMAIPPEKEPVKPDTSGFVRLTSREKEVLSLAARGMTTSQIASQLFVSTLTVRSHFKNIYPKLGVNSRTEAVVYAMQHGLH